ncbi:UDP-rhamnose:rhamnosyltransferase 1 [Olea europaea subsp. europaea]|uniref:UDP-rhamnose:rhamnosyltransferase 1 n=1 Tax=Olea europaea subsp. europaea TaxID=158383 RepID=A0A8S0S6X0_OLEEU|nr:UDP-rhamnose:rhamnosyltransferase 1 [Olea europaea subsp. europaea]
MSFVVNAWFLAFLGPPDTMIYGSDERKRAEDFTIPPKWIKFETKAAYRRYEANWIVGATQKNESGVTDLYRTGKLKLLEELYHKPVIPVSLMPPQVEEDHSESWVSIKTWLDDQNKQSVVYVALGTEVTSSQDQINELALGLELSDVPFFWALRNIWVRRFLLGGFTRRVRRES